MRHHQVFRPGSLIFTVSEVEISRKEASIYLSVLNFDDVSKRKLCKTEENLNEKSRSATIKTLDLFPGSSTIRNDERKSSVESPTTVTFINPKALMTAEDIRKLTFKDSIVSPF